MIPHLFIKGHFKVAVFAVSRADAYDYIRQQACSCLSYRGMKYAGQRDPGSNKEGWLAANTARYQAQISAKLREQWATEAIPTP